MSISRSDLAAVRDQQQQMDIGRLKGELEQAKAEIDRLKKELVNANRGAERNAHINRQLADKLQDKRRHHDL